MFRVEMLGLDDLLDGIETKHIESATISAMNRVASMATTAALRETRSEWAIKAGDFRKYARVVKRAGRGTNSISFKISSSPIPLIAFGAKQNSRGVTYRLKKKVGRQLLRHAFIAQLRSAPENVFMRKNKKRFPIIKKTAVSPTTMFGQVGADVFIEIFSNKFPKRFWHEIDRRSKS